MGVLEWLGSTSIEWEMIVTATVALVGTVTVAVLGIRSSKVKASQDALTKYVEELGDRVKTLETRVEVSERRVVRYRAWTLKLQAQIWRGDGPPPVDPDVDPEAD